MTLLHARHRRLQGCVTRLHGPAGDLVVADLGSLDGDDEVHAPGAESERDRGGVEDHHVADRHGTAELRIGDGRRAGAVDLDLQLVRARTRGSERDHDAASQTDHAGPGSVLKAPL